MIFRDREHAASLLIGSGQLERFRSERPVVFGIPRGAVPMAGVIARYLQAPLDVVLVHKFGLDSNPEYALGAVSEEGDIYLGEGARRLGLGEQEIEKAAKWQVEQLQLRRRILTPHRKSVGVKGRTAVVIDDGIATGATMIAAVRYLREKGAARIVVAVPVATEEALQNLQRQGENIDVIALSVPENFFSVSQFYENFPQVTDKEVVEALRDGESPEIVIREGDTELRAFLHVPEAAKGIVIFAHGSGSGRKSTRNQLVARTLHEAGIATLLADLLTESESEDRDRVFDIDLLSQRLRFLVQWLRGQRNLKGLPIAFFGASTGAAAALHAAASEGDSIVAVVSRGGRPDLAWESLAIVRSPTLLIVGSDDEPVVSLNRRAYDQMTCEKKLEIVAGATHLFEEPGTLETVAELARVWLIEKFNKKEHATRREAVSSVGRELDGV